MDLTGELASLCMLGQDKKFTRKCKIIGLSLPFYYRYVDDTLNSLRGIKLNWNFCSKTGRMVLSENNNENIEKHTMDVLTKIANSMDPEIQMEPDSPSKYSN